MRLTNPCEGSLGKGLRFFRCHLWRKLVHRNGGGSKESMRVRQLALWALNPVRGLKG